MIEWIHPGLILIFGSILIPFLKGRVRSAYLLLLPVLAFVAVVSMSHGVHGAVHFMDYTLVFGRVDKLSLVFGYIFTIMAFIGVIYGLHVKKSGEPVAAFLYVGSSLGVVFAGDLLTVFIFWEIMAFSSVFLIWFEDGKAARAAGFRYILVHIFGGVTLLGGIVVYYVETGSLQFNAIDNIGWGFYLILVGFIINAAVPPFQAWLKNAYPAATITGAVFLCAFTTKTAVYVLMRGFPGTELLVVMGVIMALYGVGYAVLENDMRRLLAYHIISQVGFMVAGIGMGTHLSLNGTASHAFAHILYKGLLFMGTGAIIHMTGKRKLTELGGLYKTMPITLILYMIGAFSISAFPLFSGFVSKSMIISAAAEEHRAYTALLLTLASSGTFLSLGLKLPYFAFFGKDSGIKAADPPLNMLLGMGAAAFLCVFIGVYPNVLYHLLPYNTHYVPYTGEHVVASLQILLFTGLAFFMLLKVVKPKAKISLDTDWLYRKGAIGFLWLAKRPIVAVDNFVCEIYSTGILEPAKRSASYCSRFDLGIIDGLVNFAGWLTRLTAWGSHKFDIYVVDGLINSMATLVGYESGFWRRLQSGYLQNYALIFILGLLLILGGVLLS
jgi:multicomponent Na+:H+ antiporter subunit D